MRRNKKTIPKKGMRREKKTLKGEENRKHKIRW